MKRYWLSTPKISMSVTVDENNVIKGNASTVKIVEPCGCELYQDCEWCRPVKFIGQSLDNLLNWMEKQGQVEMMEI